MKTRTLNFMYDVANGDIWTERLNASAKSLLNELANAGLAFTDPDSWDANRGYKVTLSPAAAEVIEQLTQIGTFDNED